MRLQLVSCLLYKMMWVTKLNKPGKSYIDIEKKLKFQSNKLFIGSRKVTIHETQFLEIAIELLFLTKN